MISFHQHNQNSLLVFLFACIFINIPTAHAFELRGLVIDFSRAPLQDAQVWVSHDRRVFSTTTDVDGRFSIDNIESGKIEIVAMKSGHALGGKEGQFLGNDSVTIRLHKSRDLPMRIINARYEPVNGARLKHLAINETYSVNVEDLVPHGFPSIRSNADGIMTLLGMPLSGVASMTVTHPDYAEGQLATFPIGRDINLVMEKGIKIRGRVTNNAGDGVARARIAVAKVQKDRHTKFSEVLSDKDGFYTVSAPPDRYIVVAMHQDYAIGIPESVKLRAGFEDATVNIELRTAYIVRGFAKYESGEPLPLVRIEYRDASGAITAESVCANDGTFTITVPAGEGTLVISPPNGIMTVTSPEIPIKVEGDSKLTVPDIVLKPLPAITGTVHDRKGKPVSQAFVRTINADPPILTQTDEAGHFQIQLESVAGLESIQIYAEHPVRFSRAINTIDLRNIEPQKLVLKSFKPTLGFMPELASNNLSDLHEQPAPEWSCQDWFNLPEGKESLSVSELKGNIVVLTFWAGFDLTGKTERRLTELKYLYSVFGQEKNIVFVSIHDASLKPYEVELILRSQNFPFAVGCDDELFTSFKNYKINQIPQTVIIDPKGNLRYYEVEGRLHTLVKAMRRKR